MEKQEGSKVGRLRSSVSEQIRNVVQQKTEKKLDMDGCCSPDGPLLRCRSLSLLKTSPRHIHTALSHAEQHWEGKVQEIGPDPPQVAVIMGVRAWCKPAYLQSWQWNCSSRGCVWVRYEAL